jgi:hypothetical protein
VKVLIDGQETSTSPSLPVRHHCKLHFRSPVLCPRSGMKLLGLALCSLPSLSLSLAYPTAGQKQGSVQIYSDSDCSIKNGSPVPLLINTCLQVNESSSISAATLPSCGNGKTPVLTISDQENCGPPSIIEPSISSGSVGKCLFFATGSTIASTGFTCVGEGATTSSSHTESGPTATLEPVSTASTAAEPTANSQPTANNDETLPSSLLPIDDRIALGVGIGIGIPALMVAIFTWWTNWKTLDQWRRQNDDLPPPYEMHGR